MKNLNKLFAVALALLTMVSFTACDDENDDPDVPLRTPETVDYTLTFGVNDDLLEVADLSLVVTLNDGTPETIVLDASTMTDAIPESWTTNITKVFSKQYQQNRFPAAIDCKVVATYKEPVLGEDDKLNLYCNGILRFTTDGNSTQTRTLSMSETGITAEDLEDLEELIADMNNLSVSYDLSIGDSGELVIK